MPQKSYGKTNQYIDEQFNDPVFCLVVHDDGLPFNLFNGPSFVY